MAQWFKLHEGTGTETCFSLIAKNLNIKRGMVISAWFYVLENASKGNPERGQISINCEEMDYWLELEDGQAAQIIAAFEARNKITKTEVVNWKEMQGISDAERKRNYRNKSQNVPDMSQTSADSHGQGTIVPAREREREKERKIPLTPTEVGARSFLKTINGFDAGAYLRDEDWHELTVIAPSWDRQGLVRKYSSWVATNPPKDPRAAFMAWVPKFTKGKKPS